MREPGPKAVIVVALAGAHGLRGQPARAQLAAGAQASYPSRPIRLIMPVPPGGRVDLTARLPAEPPSRAIDGQGTSPSAVIENRGRTGGVEAAEHWYGLAAPGTIIAFLSKEVRQVMAELATARRFDEAGLHPATLPVEEHLAYLRRDSETWARVVRDGNIRVDSD